MCATGESQVRYEILAYLTEHQAAQDTLEGVVWWLLEQSVERHTREVKAALAELVARGLIVERVGTDSRIHYRINQEKRDEIARLLRQSHL